MTAVAEKAPITLEERLANGADLLFDMERRGETGPNYRRWLATWLEMLEKYETVSQEQAVA